MGRDGMGGGLSLPFPKGVPTAPEKKGGLSSSYCSRHLFFLPYCPKGNNPILSLLLPLRPKGGIWLMSIWG